MVSTVKLLHSPKFTSIQPAFSKALAIELFNTRLHTVRDCWCDTISSPLPCQVAQTRFRLRDKESPRWETIYSALTDHSGGILHQEVSSLGRFDWLGLFPSTQSHTLALVVPAEIFYHVTGNSPCRLQISRLTST